MTLPFRASSSNFAVVTRAAPAALLAVLLLSGPASAACTDAAQPNVEWRRCAFVEAELRGAHLAGAVLRDGSFDRADLREADLTDTQAYRAKFVSADLRGARLDHAVLAEADFTRADLGGASLVESDLRRARFFRASLRGADLSRAQVVGADFLNCDLSNALWIDGKRRCAEGSVGRCN
jgi:uncharacterized protein YjbI with pentapeptide repeats